MAPAHGFLAKIFKVFEDFDVSVDAITTSEISVAMTIDMKILANNTFIEELEKLGKIKVEKDFALVSIIGNQINTTPGIANKIFNGVGDTNVRMICQGASVHNFLYLLSKLKALTLFKAFTPLLLSNKALEMKIALIGKGKTGGEILNLHPGDQIQVFDSQNPVSVDKLAACDIAIAFVPVPCVRKHYSNLT